MPVPTLPSDDDTEDLILCSAASVMLVVSRRNLGEMNTEGVEYVGSCDDLPVLFESLTVFSRRREKAKREQRNLLEVEPQITSKLPEIRFQRLKAAGSKHLNSLARGAER